TRMPVQIISEEGLRSVHALHAEKSQCKQCHHIKQFSSLLLPIKEQTGEVVEGVCLRLSTLTSDHEQPAFSLYWRHSANAARNEYKLYLLSTAQLRMEVISSSEFLARTVADTLRKTNCVQQSTFPGPRADVLCCWYYTYFNFLNVDLPRR